MTRRGPFMRSYFWRLAFMGRRARLHPPNSIGPAEMEAAIRADARAALLGLLLRRPDPSRPADHRHNTAILWPVWRSDLVGWTCPNTGARHGWWCPTCEARKCPVETGHLRDPKVLHTGPVVRWRVYLAPDFKVRVEMPAPLEPPELARFITALERAQSTAAARRAAAEARALGHVGWRVSTVSGAPVVWYWEAANVRRGCALVHIRPRTETSCRVCSGTIEAGHSCWRGDGSPDRAHLRELDGWSGVRVCVRCIATLTEEAWKDEPAEVTRRGRKAAVLRLVQGVS